MRIKAIIFDLDGTLLNTLDDLCSSVNYALNAFKLPLRDKQDVRRFLGNGIRRLIELSVPDGSSNVLVENVLTEFRAHYLIHSLDKTKPYPGINAMLNECQKKKILTAIVSNKLDPAVQDLKEEFFDETVDIAIGETADIRRKPAPDMVNKALEQLECSADESIYVGDSEVDLLTAKNAGLRCVAVSWGFRDKEELMAQGAETIIDHPKELIEKIMAFNF